METAVLSKRVWAYLIDMIFYYASSFASALPLLLIVHLHYSLYIIISVGIAMVLSFFLTLFLLNVTHGYTLGNALFGIRFVSSSGQRITFKTALIRAALEAIVIYALFDLFYFMKNRTERGVIDRLSDSFGIDTRI